MSRVRNLVDYQSQTADLDGDATRDLNISGTVTAGAVASANVPDVNLTIAPEVLEIQVDAPDAGQDIMWKWTWEQSTLPYARRTITNSAELNVPLYKEGTYVVNNFAAYDIHGSMTQTHSLYLKWVNSAGTDNLVSWATSAGPISDTHPDINGGNATDVQRITVNVPATITPPSLTNPSVAYTVTNTASGSYTFSGSAKGDNPNLGPFYRGGTYTININATGHPFYFTTDNGTNFSAGTYFGEYTTGVTGSRTDSGTITFTVPAGAPDTLYYQCGNHGVMRGEITVKDLAVETNINGNYVVYFQHTQEGHATPVELRPIPSLVNQMCIVYDAGSGKFVPQDLATYVENTPSFENKIREVAGTAELVVEDGSAVIAKVNVYDDSTYLPLTGNNPGDQAFATDTDILYIWDGSAWQQAGAANSDDLTEGSTNLFYTSTRANTDFDTRIATKSTTDLSEGTNLYYTDERVDDRVGALIIGGNNITSTYDDAAGTLTLDGQPGYTDSDVGTYLSNNGYDTATNIIATITDSAPGTLDTLNELAAALGDDPNFATTVTNSIADKLPLAGGALTGALNIGGSAGSMKLNVNGDIYLGDNAGWFGMYTDQMALGSDGSVHIVADANTDNPNTVNPVKIGFGNSANVDYDQSRGSSLDSLASPAITTAEFYSNRAVFYKDLILNPMTSSTSNTEGAMYYDSDDNTVKFYDGSSWIPLGGNVNRYNYTATANQTSFAATYTATMVDVYLNGTKLTRVTDYTDTSGTAVVLTTGADIGDLINIVAFSAHSAGDAVSIAGGTFTGTVDFDQNINVTNTVNALNVRVTNTGDLTLAGSGHAFQIGPTSGQNIAMDNNEIMSRNNGVGSELHLNPDGGDVTINNQGALSSGSKLVVRNRIELGDATNATTKPTALLHIHKSFATSNPVTLDEAPSIVLSENETTGAGDQGYHGAYWFGSQDTNTPTDYNWKVAGMASQSVGNDTQGNVSTGNLEFYTTNATSSATKSAELSKTGDWSVPAQPAFEMIKTTDTVGTANANNYIRYDTVQFETGGSGCSTSTGQYTAPADGLYHFSISFTVDAGDGVDDSMGVGFIIANNSYYNQNYTPNTGHRVNPRYDSRAGTEHTYSFQKTARLSEGATIGFYITDWNFAGTNLQHAEFSGHKFA